MAKHFELHGRTKVNRVYIVEAETEEEAREMIEAAHAGSDKVDVPFQETVEFECFIDKYGNEL